MLFNRAKLRQGRAEAGRSTEKHHLDVDEMGHSGSGLLKYKIICMHLRGEDPSTCYLGGYQEFGQLLIYSSTGTIDARICYFL